MHFQSQLCQTKVVLNIQGKNAIQGSAFSMEIFTSITWIQGPPIVPNDILGVNVIFFLLLG
jgi:hypothetical protein